MKNILVVGAGLIGIRHIQEIQNHPSCKLAGVVEPNETLAKNIDAPRFGAMEEVDVDIDGVIIATPNALHLPHAQYAANRKWHMLIEKPVAETLDQARAIVAATHSAGVKTLIGHHRRHHSKVQKLREIIQSGMIGEPVTATAIWAVKKPDDYFKGTWREGPHGSPILINLVHDIDTLRFVLGNILEITGLGSSRQRATNRLESGVACLKFENGCIAAISFSDTAPSPWGFEAGTGENPNIAATGQDMMWIAGTKGAVSFPTLTVWSGANDWSEAAKPTCHDIASNIPLQAQLTHFCSVMEGLAEPLINATDGLETLDAALKTHDAIMANGAV